MKRHDETLLWQYAARELDAETAALTEHHLSECVDCREGLLDVRQARLYVQDAQTPKPQVDWAKVDAGGSFDLSQTPYFAELPRFGFVSGKSTHNDRIKTIRFAQGRYNVMLDTHTADGLKVALENRLPGVPMIVLETAQPAKFEETIREALGTEPVRPSELVGIEKLPQHVVVMAPDVAAVKQFVVDHV